MAIRATSELQTEYLRSKIPDLSTSDRTPMSGPGVLLVLLTMAMVMMPRVCGAGNDGRVPWRGLITLECRITSAREETSNLMPNLPLLTTKWN